MGQADDTLTPDPGRSPATRSRGLLSRLREALGGSLSPTRRSRTTRLGRYRLLQPLGQGGMGTVYAAEDESLGRRIAVKTIREPDESSRRRFRREARAAAAVNHPNVCQIYEIGEDSGQLFIAMELLSGESLADRLRRGPLPVAEALALGDGVLAALAALHETGVVHRDLKPSNVFVTPHGVKLLDFGLARPLPSEVTRTLEAGDELTRPGLIVGTPRYMAPEQVRGGEIDARTDVFSAGAVLYEAVAGRPAFLGTSAVEVLSATLHEQPPALAGSASVVALDRVLRRALAKRPEDRFASAAEMARALDAVPAAGDSGTAALARPLTRLVVVPFRLLRPDPEVEFLCFGLADAVSGTLAGLPGLVLRSSAAAARLEKETPDLRRVAAEIEVDLVLTGTLMRAGEQLRVTTQLVEAPAGTLVASQTLQSAVGDVFGLQDELARRIVESLSPQLAGREPVGRPRRSPGTARAYEFYLRANEVIRDWSQAAVARDLYRQCVEEDPQFAPAWAKLGRCHRLLAKYHLDQPARNLEEAEAAFRRALELDPELPVAHKLYAHHEAEMGRARDAMVRLLRLAHGAGTDPEVFSGLVHACRYCGLLDASEAAHREARRLDPNAATSMLYTWWARGDAEAILRDATEASDVEARVLALHALGRSNEALELLLDSLDRPVPPVYARLRRQLVPLIQERAEAKAGFAEIVAMHTDPEALFLYGCCQARLGDRDAALATLAAAAAGGYHVPQAFATQPWLASLQQAPELATLLARAEVGQRAALAAFADAGGPSLLGTRGA